MSSWMLSETLGFIVALSAAGPCTAHSNTVLWGDPILTSCRKKPAHWDRVYFRDVRSRNLGR